MRAILKREVKNYIRNPLLWLGIAVGALMIFQEVGSYLDIHYLAEGETIANDYPETYRDGDVFDMCRQQKSRDVRCGKSGYGKS